MHPVFVERDSGPGPVRGLISAFPFEIDLDKFDMGQQWAYITWSADDVVGCLNVIQEHRRKGIATRLFVLAQTIRPGLRHSSDLTPDAAKWVAAMKIRQA